MGAGVPVIIFIHAIFNKDEDRIAHLPLLWFWAVYIICNFISAQIILYKNVADGVETFFRVFNGFLGYYWFQRYFREKNDFKQLLWALLVAGIFPIGIGVFQFITGYSWKAWAAEGGMRNIGLYHDQATLKYYFFQTVAAIILYWSYFLDRATIKKCLLVSYLACTVIVLYKLYVKSGNIVLGFWIVLWTGLRKQFVLTLLLIAGILLLNWVADNKLVSDIAKVYHKEIGTFTGEEKVERSLAGRWYIWKSWLEDWKDSGVLAKFFGTGKTGYSAHNDFLFVVERSGIMGLLSYCALLGAVGTSVLLNLRKGAGPLRIMALMVFFLWLVEAIGLVPSGYISFQWFAWGFIGLSLRLEKVKDGWAHNVSA